MKFSAVLVSAFAAVAMASPMQSSQQGAVMSQSEAMEQISQLKAMTKNMNTMFTDASAPASDNCSYCTQYCSDPSNGAAIGAACYIVKCGIQCLIG